MFYSLLVYDVFSGCECEYDFFTVVIGYRLTISWF